MKRLFIICQRYLDEEFFGVTIGGIQTYIANLCQVAGELGFECCVIQYDKMDRSREFTYGRVVGVDVSNCKRLKHKNKAVFARFQQLFCPETDILIYATEGMAQKESRDYAIAIQHGISWDIRSEKKVDRFHNVIAILKNSVATVLRTQPVAHVKQLVCVDYNYPNWYRTQVCCEETKLTVVPNFSAIAPAMPNKHFQDDTLEILFARRFQTYRGTRLFAGVMKRLLKEHDNIAVTLAGDGPDEQWLRDQFAEFDRVTFTHYKSEESLEFHSQFHIAVVPTVGSEGTSLSLLEAMSSQCAVVCTNVGGMTNIIIDDYNGLVVNPDEESLYGAMKRLIEDRQLRTALAQKGYETVQYGFSHELWKTRWIKVLKEHDPSNAE